MTNLNSLQKCNCFNFNAEHNGIPCIVSTRPEDQGTEHQVWFTRQMLREIFDVKSENTITNNVDALVNRGVVDNVKNLILLQSSRGLPTMLYDLKVFNLLAMRLDTDRAWEVKGKFNDILVEKETKQNTLPAVSKEDHFLLGIIHAESKEQTVIALKDYKNYRDEQQRAVEQERDEAIRIKAFISSKREATLMGKVGGTTKALNFEREKNTKLLKENMDLIKEKEDLKDQNEDLIKERDRLFRSFGCTPEKHGWLTIAMMNDIWKKEFDKKPQWQDLKRIIKENDLVEPVRDVKEFVNNTERLVNRYPRRAWELYYNEELERKNQTQE